MAIGGLVPVLSTREWFDFEFSMLWIWVKEARKKTRVRRCLFNRVVDWAYVVYILARVVILVVVFSAFRAIPRDVYADVQWAAFLPHVD